MNTVDFNTLVPATRMRGDSDRDTALLRQMHKEAESYICSYDWCKQVIESYLGLGIGGVVAVFLFKIIPNRDRIDDLLWVVVGDLPPAYLVTVGNPTPVSALEAYLAEMTDWVDAVDNGRPIDELIPVNSAPTKESADLLRKRLSFLREKVLPLYKS